MRKCIVDPPDFLEMFPVVLHEGVHFEVPLEFLRLHIVLQLLVGVRHVVTGDRAVKLNACNCSRQNISAVYLSSIASLEYWILLEEARKFPIFYHCLFMRMIYNNSVKLVSMQLKHCVRRAHDNKRNGISKKNWATFTGD